jgi:hypothetical protein
VLESPDVLGRGLERLVDQFRHKPHLRALLSTYLDALSQASEAIAELPRKLSVREATGRPLDLLGSDVGQARDGVNDERYRALVRSRTRLNRSSGSVEDILSLARVLLLPSSLRIRTHRLEIELFAYGETAGFATNIATAASLIASTTAAGVRLWLNHFPCTHDDAFGFDNASGFDVGRFGASFLTHQEQ